MVTKRQTGVTPISPSLPRHNPGLRLDNGLLARLLRALSLICLLISSSAYAENLRIQEELNSPAPPIPLINAIGVEKFEMAMASGQYQYVGNTKCRMCHREFFVGRKHDAHDFALKSITKLPSGNNPRCLICHSTGYGVPGGFISFEKTPRLSDVQCEGCHGPGSVHVANRDKGGFLAGTDHLDRLRKMCLGCHTPRWNRSYIDLEKAFKKYKQPQPE
ncbi:MAG: cytochrome c family protein [Sulfurimicrobium sp.]|nr:cytochrome c family protein [Sulfurimicrobium sp.]MDZ7657374.1 cytochrome c family protein [Sulfurimicrobium sp.]